MSNDHREPVRVPVFSASLRAESFNTRLASLAAKVLERLGASVDLASMREFDAPSYDGDLETAGVVDSYAFARGAVVTDSAMTGTLITTAARQRLPCTSAAHRMTSEETAPSKGG